MNSRSNARAGTSQPGRLAARRRKPHFFALLVASVVVVAVILSVGGSQAFFLIPSVVPARTTALAGLARAAEGDPAASKPGALPASDCRQELWALSKTEARVGYHLRKFMHEQGVEPTFQLSDAPEATVRQFLVLHAEGSLEQFEVASADALAELDGVRGRDVFAYWQWHEVTGQQAFGTKRPDGVPAQVVNQFLETFKADGFERLEMGTAIQVAKVRAFQKRSIAGHALWKEFCASHRGQEINFDPKSWPAEHLQRFLIESKEESA
ncbi:unnamed protein product [Polarella glacialis]|uniref:Uncharacterized protein n=1 Tax=Polarella glacialis TaxID=89957 RepID=A0A813EE48_POLGL|nr:unnamed protein product [Polarella glacialis]